MFWHKTSILLELICFCLAFATSARSLRLEDHENKCTHGGILNGVFLHGGIQSRNDTIFSNIPSMEACIEKCCRTSKCDLAMKVGSVCHAVNCQDDDSCQISHKKKGTELRAEISFITKGEVVKEVATAKTRKPSLEKQKVNFQQSIINKKPTFAAQGNTPKTTPRVTKFVPLLQPAVKQNDEQTEAAASGSGSASGSLEEEDRISGSGLVTDDIEEALGATTKVHTTVKETDENNLLGLGPSIDTDNASPEATLAKLPSASRSAIPTPSKQGQFGTNLVQSLKSYSFMEEDQDNEDRDNKSEESLGQDDHEDKDENNDEKLKAKTSIEYKANGKATNADKDEKQDSMLMSFKKGKLDKIQKTEEILKENDDVKYINNENLKHDTANTILNDLKNAVSDTVELDKSKKGQGKTTVEKPNSRSGSNKVRTGKNASLALISNSENGHGNANDETDLGSGLIKTRKQSVEVVGSDTENAEGTDETVKKTLRNTNTLKDYNSVTRGTISGLRNKASLKNVNVAKKANTVERRSKSGKFSVRGTKSSVLKKKEQVTPLQKQLSTLFSKNAKNFMPIARSLKKPSKKSEFEKIQRLQRQRDRNRHHGKGQNSLSLLYAKKSERDKVKFVIHRFNEWHGWKRDQLLNVPRENTKCRRGVTIRGATLRGGILAGDFKTVGIVSNQHACVNSCCRNRRCDVALMLGKECFNVKCYSTSLCGIAPATAIFDEVTPVLTYVRGHISKRSADIQEENDSIPEERNDKEKVYWT
ncbi:uncharacterized protein LOC135681349 isoform X2 [Rhopilema esculentum]|uniref:uncharacterized protein LOC135681349 isoform X2 n=1 Tax=Rhopilema esculentum TaxID=499914 RepID=UPI0031D41A99